MAVLFRNFFNAHQDAIRRIGFWGGAALAVFFLFWGVNALNSQREVAMRTRYDIPRETPAVSSEAPEPVVERPVVITPAPVRSAPPAVADASATVATPAVTVPVKGSYVIQVVTYPTRQDAERIVKSFEQAGIRAYVEESTRPSGRLFYWVLIGGFRTEAEAQAELLKFRANEMARPFQDAFVKLRRS